MHTLSLFGVTFLATLALGISIHDDPLLKATEHGAIRGEYNRRWFDFIHPLRRIKDPKAVPRVFYKIPYADPPVDKLRYRSPHPVSRAWGSVDEKTGEIHGEIRDATHTPVPCIQPILSGKLQSEDCLYLNVYTPPAMYESREQPMPVLVWIYGGAFLVGDGIQMGLYNGRHVTAYHNAIIVTFNYRLGPLGFFAASDGKSMNFGLEDQLAALEWVKRNIHHFGGDPNKVTLFGESAGATSISAHMVHPKAADYMDRALMLSPPFGVDMIPAEDMRASSIELARKLRCASNDTIDMDCMRSKNPLKILWHGRNAFTLPPHPKEMSRPFRWWPAIDNVTVNGQPRDLFAQGKAVNIPTMMGFTSNETALWMLPLAFPVLRGLVGGKDVYEHPGYTTRISTIFGKFAEKVKSVHPVTVSLNDNAEHFTRLTTSYAFTCSGLHAARGVHENRKLWMYEFDRPGVFPTMLGACNKHTCHTADIRFFFHSFKHDQENAKIAKKMQQYLVNFATTGNPNTPSPHDRTVMDVAPWPAYRTEKASIMLIDHDFRLQSNYTQSNCTLWDELGFRF